MSKNVTMAQLRNSRFLVGLKGGNATCISPEGEVLWQVGYSGGMHFADQLKEYMRPDDEILLEGAITLVSRQGKVLTQSFGEVAMQSGANPDFRPTSATEAEMKMRRMLQQVNEASNSLNKRMKVFHRLIGEKEQRAAVKAAQQEVIDHEAETAEAPQKPAEGQEGTASKEGVPVPPQGEVSA